MTTQKITKKNLKKIYDVACATWKAKLESYASRNPFEADVELTSDEVNEMFKASDDNQKNILDKFLIRDNGVMDKVTSYKTACKVLGIEPNHKTSYERLTTIIKALNNGWKPNFKDSNERKYYNYFHNNQSGFSFYAVYCYYTNMLVPSALYLKDEETALYANKIAFKEYEDLYLE
jgi:hypothetical protein